MKFGYARVSTRDQILVHQQDALKSCDKIYAEKMSGADRARPELARLLSQLRPGDEVVVWKLDRMARNLRDLLEISRVISDAGASMVSMTEGFNTGGPMGKFLLGIFGAMAEFERELIRERTAVGRERARREGRRLGGQMPKLNADQRAHACELVRGGRSRREVGELMGVSRSTVSRIVARESGEEQGELVL